MKNTFLTTAAILALAIGANAQTTPATSTNQPATTTQPTTAQPVTTQPATTQPATAQPATTQPATAQPVTPAETAGTAAATAQQPAATTMAAPRSYGSTADSIHAKYQYLPMPGEWTAEKAFPVLGTYQLNGGATQTAGNISITMDSASKGIVWISGLPQGTVKAYLAKSPATYRIISQKTAEGKSVPEGTVVFSPETNTLNIALGAYYAADPASIFPVVAPVVAADGSTPAVDATIASAPAVATVKVKSEGSKGKSKSKSKVTFYTATKVNALNNTGSNAAFGDQLQQANQQ
ncbi:MAG: hypothetical protein EOP50_01955 [Sphingobacteriales bacterium]|nr:MAG: hypothetical protein EOP50_01955 [Sphingobacteriales bacterium]